MLPKPPSCSGCPFYGDGWGFVPDRIVPGAKLLIIGQNPGEEEEAKGAPYVGKTGQVMDKQYLPQTGFDRSEVSIGNVLRCRKDHKNALPPITHVDVQEAIAHCTQAHAVIPSNTRLILAQGDYATLGTTGDPSSTEWRGWMIPYVGSPERGVHSRQVWTPVLSSLPVLVTIHLARLFREPELTLPTLADWGKVKRFFNSRWPNPLPSIESLAPGTWPGKFAFDTEFDPTGALVRYSMTDGVKLYCIEAKDHLWNPAVTNWPSQQPHAIFQNIDADVGYLQALMGKQHQVTDWRLDDTMLAHSVLYSDMPHDLDFLGSLYAPTNRWKHLFQTNLRQYSAGDAWGTWWVWRAFEAEFKNDVQSETIYRDSVLPLWRVIQKAERPGIRTWQPRVVVAEQQLAERVRQATLRAQAASGWPINLGSTPQVGQQLYAVEGLKQGKGKKK